MFADAEFVKLKDFIKSLIQIHHHKSSLATKAELETMVSLKFKDICGPKKRFPDGVEYVNVSFGFYADAFSDLFTLKADDPRLKKQLRSVLEDALNQSMK